MPDNSIDYGALAQYFQPSPEDQKRALQASLMATGFGILANNTGHYGALGPALGAGGLTGMDMYSRTMLEGNKLRGDAITQGLAARKLASDLEWDKAIQARYGMGPNGSPAAAVPPSPNQPPPMPGSALPTVAPTAPQVSPQVGPQGGNMEQDRMFAEMLAAAGRPNAAAMQKAFELKYPNIKYEGGIPLHPQTGQPMPGAPIMPQTNQQGFSTTPVIGPDGKISVGMTPGAADVFGQQQDITNRSTARFGPAREVPLPNGQTQRMTPEMESDFLRGQGAPGAPAAAPAGPPSVANPTPFGKQPLVVKDEPTANKWRTMFKDMGIQMDVQVRDDQWQPGNRADSRARANATLTPTATATAAPSGMPGITVGKTDAERIATKAEEEQMVTAAKTGAEGGAAVRKQIDEEAQHALEQKRILREMSNAFQDFSPSKLAPAKKVYLETRQALEAYGFPKLDQKELDAVASVQDIAKLNAQLATSAMKQFTNRGTQMEFGTFLKNNPGIEMTPQGAQKIIEFMTKGADLSIAKQQEFNQWRKMQKPDQWQDFNAHWNKKTNDNLADTLSTANVDKAIDEAKNPAPKNLMRGQVVNGFRYKGGDPHSQSSWEAK